ncbi:MAG: T9SS type A sorting domain-containing protein [Bacteroidetes bacterium]|nr:T9SS type A sorting domain-containing protein [Bacteroidota bacterium]
MKAMTKVYFVFLCLFPQALLCQYLNVRVNTDNNVFYPTEESITINTRNTNQLVIGVNTMNITPSAMGYYYSSNGGYNWSGNYIMSSYGQYGSDPCVITDTSGAFYYFGLGNWRIPPPNLDKILCTKSINGGLNWTDACQLALLTPKMDDKEYACVDFSGGSPYVNYIYITWTLFDTYNSYNTNDSSNIYFSRSTNSGITFSAPVRINKQAGNCRDSSLTVEGAVPCTGPNGEIYVSWGGNNVISFDRSTNGGVTWLDDDITVTQQLGGWAGGNAFPITACDISNSPYRGNVYICFTDKRSGAGDKDVWVVRSTNSGTNWNNPVRVNNDGPGYQEYLPWMCVDQVTGYIYVVYYDDHYDYPLYNVTLARSTNGGASFKNVKISSTSSLLNGYIGDYIGVTAHDNKVRAVWNYNYYGGYPAVWVAIVDSFVPYIDHTPLQSTADTSVRTASALIEFADNTGAAGAPRLYYKTAGSQFTVVQAYEVTQLQYKFHIPGYPPGTKVYYYLAAQDSSGSIIKTLPEGGGGINPPGTTPPANLLYYEIYSNRNSCSVTLPKPILDNAITADSIYLNYPGYIVKGTVNMSLNHPNDGDLIIMLVNSGSGAITLSSRNGEGGSNYINTTFDDNASLSVTQGSPPFSGPYKPQNPLSVLSNLPLTGNWILKVLDVAPGNQGTLTNWCISFLVKSSIGVNENETPSCYKLSQNYPNPFNSATRISYSIAKSSDVTMKIYDLLGREVRTLINEYQNAGNYIVMFNAGELASGVYFYKLSAGDFTEIKKMVLVK